MNIEDQVCSLELAKKLKELGVKQDSLFYYLINFNKEIINILFKREITHSKEYYISAFTVAELGEMLPDSITLYNGNSGFIKYQKKDIEWKVYVDGLTKITIYFDENEANARAKMLIYLIENKLLEINK